MLSEFKTFALRGNVVDLAVGVIIGAAFSRIVDSAVGDLFMPVIGAITGGLDFSNYYVRLSGGIADGLSYADAKKQGAVLGWGNFVTVGINFAVIALVLFLVIRAMNRLKLRSEAAPEVPADVKILGEIRDLIADGRPVDPARS